MRYPPARLNSRCVWAPTIFLAAAALLAAPALPQSVGSELRRSATVEILERVKPSTVNIHGQKTLGPADDGYRQGETQRVNGMGTGVVIDERGYIITNHHVVEGVRKIQVTLDDGQSYVASLVSHDPKTDLAIIKINAPEKLPVIQIGTSSDLMHGESVIAVGNAYGYGHTATRGIVSALHRTVQVSDTQSYKDLIQTDASINPGNSGGPLLNVDGEMIGINVAVRAGAQGIGFAIPVDMAMHVAADLLSTKRLDNTWHGVTAKEANGAGSKEVVVGSLDEESPAAKSGLKSGDIIASIDAIPVQRPLDLERALLGHKPGEAVEITVVRNRQPVALKLELAAAPKTRPTMADKTWELIGLKLDPIPAKQFRQTQTRYRGGLLVTAVRPESPAYRQGIQRGDILVGMHIWETISLENIDYILNRANITDIEPVKFYILRDKQTLFGHLPVSLQR